MELSCAREGINVHLLGYLPDPANEALLAVQRRATESRLTRAQRIVGTARITLLRGSKCVLLLLEGGPVGRPHIADARLKPGASLIAVPLAQTLHPLVFCRRIGRPTDARSWFGAAGETPLAHCARGLAKGFCPSGH